MSLIYGAMRVCEREILPGREFTWENRKLRESRLSRSEVGKWGREDISREGRKCALALWQETPWGGQGTERRWWGARTRRAKWTRCVWSRVVTAATGPVLMSWLLFPQNSCCLRISGDCLLCRLASSHPPVRVVSNYRPFRSLREIIWWGQPASTHDNMALLDRGLMSCDCTAQITALH